MRPEPRSAPRRVMPWGEIPRGSFPGDGLVVVDKDSGVTSHDVVGAIRRLSGTKKVGHAGTLDPMATGVLCVGIGRVTKLLRYITGADKEYEATIRFGIETSTEDADGEQVRVPVVGEVVEAVPSPEEGATPSAGGTASGSGPINVNTASAEELERLPGIGPALAERIVSHRQAHGPFASLDDLTDVPGIGRAKLEALRAEATV